MTSFNTTYRVGPTLGTGQAFVKQCTHIRTSEHYAVKFIPKSTTRCRQSVYAERDVMRALRGHPNVTKLHEIYEDAEHVALVMELVRGCDLHELRCAMGGRMRPTLTGVVLSHVLSALSFAHSKGIVHHDIKPENIIVDYQNKKVKLIDFGSATESGKTPMRKSDPGNGLSGTMEFLPPEAFTNRRGAGGKKLVKSATGAPGDVWSIGVMTYLLLSGNHPFDTFSDHNSHVTKRIISGKFEFPESEWSQIPEECRDFVKQCLAVDPKKRASAVELLKHPWLVSCREAAGESIAVVGEGACDASGGGVTAAYPGGGAHAAATHAGGVVVGGDWFTEQEKSKLEKRKTKSNSDSLKSLYELFSQNNLAGTQNETRS